MVDYEDSYYYPQSGSDQRNGKISVNLEIFRGDNNNFKAGTIIEDVKVRFYARWRDGNNGGALDFSDTVDVIQAKRDDNLGDLRLFIDILYSQVKEFNRVDYMELEYSDRTDTYTFTQFNYLVQTTPTRYGSRHTDTILAISSFSPSVSQDEVNDFSGKINASFDINSYDLWVVGVEGVDNFASELFPFRLPLLISTFDFTGSVLNIEDLRFEIKAGRLSEREPDFTLDPDVTGTFTPPVILPPVVEGTFIPYTVLAEFRTDFRILVHYAISPRPTDAEFGLVRLKTQILEPVAGAIETVTTNNRNPMQIVGSMIKDGETFRYQIEYEDKIGKLYKSEFFTYERDGNDLIVNEVFFEQETIRSSNIHINKVRDTYIEGIVLNDNFNSEMVLSLDFVNNTDSAIPKVNVLNTSMSSKISFELTGLTANTIYDVSINAITDKGEILIQRLQFNTTISTTDSSPDDMKEKKAIQEIIHTAFDNDIIASISVLNIDAQNMIVANVLQDMNAPENLGLTPDRNEKNRKSSIFTKPTPDAVSTRFPLTIDRILSGNILNIPDVDEE